MKTTKPVIIYLSSNPSCLDRYKELDFNVDFFYLRYLLMSFINKYLSKEDIEYKNIGYSDSLVEIRVLNDLENSDALHEASRRAIKEFIIEAKKYSKQK